MHKMKDSGIEWIGEIPENWSVSKIGSLYTLRVTKVSDRDYPPLSVTNKGIVPQLETAAKTNAHDDRKLVCKGDFAINSRSDRRGSCGISAYTGSVSLINIILRPITEMNPQYYDWLFHTIQFGDEFYKWGHGIVDDLWTTGWQDMKKITIPIAPIKEQQKIADFLDKKCAEIDSLISDIQQQIETLEQYKRSVITEAVTKGLNPDTKMKDSGIEWIGKIPEHWQVKKLKYIAKLSPHCDFSRISDETVIEYLPMEYIKNGYYIHNSKKYSEIPDSLTPFESGDIVFAKVTPCFENGNIAIMDNITSGVGLGSSELYVIRPFAINRMFIFYWLQNSGFVDKAVFSMTGMGGLKRVPSQFINNLPIVLLPIEEQEKIADYLDKKCTEIDKIISEKKQQIETIEEYKKSLIFEYVTGKKEIQI